jgi:hypothetical protein
MTDLLHRPSSERAGSSRPTSGLASRLASPLGRLLGGGRGGSSRGSLDDVPEARPITVSAALAAVGSIATGLVVFMAVAVIGWFLADAGAHGQTTDALLVGTEAWLVGLGSGLSVGGVPLGIVPLALTGVIALIVFRWGRWAGETSAPVDDDRALGLAATILTGITLVVAVVLAVLLGAGDSGPGVGRTIIGSLLVPGMAGTAGLAVGSGRLRALVDRVPGWVRSVVYGAGATFLLLLAASAVLVAVMVVLGLNQAASVMSGLHLTSGDMVMLTSVAVVPNAVLLGASYLLGPGFAVGTGTVVSPSVVTLGSVPAFPLLAALPGNGPVPEWAIGLMAIPVLVAMVGAVLAQRAYGVTAYDSAALRGFGSGFGAALLTTVAIALAGGPMGTGRMADIGAPVADVLVSAVASMSLGGLVAGLVTAWWQRRVARRADSLADRPVD